MHHSLLPPALRRAVEIMWIAGAVAFGAGCGTDDGGGPTPSAEPAEADGPVMLEDVAVLLPLPAKGGAPDSSWPASAEVSAGHALLPPAIGKQFPLLQEDPSATYESLHVVALRLDPCAPVRGSIATECEPEVRFVLQPLVQSADGDIVARDAAIHVSYRLSLEPFLSLLATVRAGRTSVARSPLGVHSAFEGQGGNAFVITLKAKTLETAATGKLGRVTFMTLRARGNEWQFGGVDVSPDVPLGAPVRIFPGQVTVQSMVLQESARTFSKSVFPPPADSALLPLLSERAMRSVPPEELLKGLAAANSASNPDARTTENSDCVSCHTAHTSATWAERELGVSTNEGRYTSPTFDLAPRTVAANDNGVLRAFGYLGRSPIVSPRTIHEAAKSARQANGILQKRGS